MHLFVDQKPIVRPEDEVTLSKVKEYFNFKNMKFDGFNPNIKKSDLVPDPDDFMLFPFRLISATTLGAGTWKATDFTNAKVLKDSVSMLSNKPAYLNHRLVTGEEIGIIGETKWSEAFIAPDGTRVPAGIDGPYVIDSKLYPELCRKLNSPMSPIQSSSVTVVFDWEASHEFENENDFYWHLGEVVNGEMVRRVVTNINDYIESSLVYLGADPYAKKKDGAGNLINIDKTGIVSNMKYDKDPLYSLYKQNKELYVLDSFSKDKSIPLRERIIINSNSQNENSDDMKIDSVKFSAKLGVKPEEITDELLEKFSFLKNEDHEAIKEKAGKFDTLSADNEKLKGEKTQLEKEKGDLSKEVETLKAEKSKLEGEKTKLESFAKVGQELFDKKKKECVELYKKAMGDKANQVIIDEINACADSKALDAKIEMFGGTLYETFGAHCKDCGSKEIDFRSSLPEGDGGKSGKSGDGSILLSSFRS